MSTLSIKPPKIGRINRNVLIVVSAVICLLFFIGFLRGLDKKNGSKPDTSDIKSSASSFNSWIPEHLTYEDVLREQKLPGSTISGDNAEIEKLRRELADLKTKLQNPPAPVSKHTEIVTKGFEKPLNEKRLEPPKRPDSSKKDELELTEKAHASEIFFTNTAKEKESMSPTALMQVGNSDDPLAAAKQRLSMFQNNIMGQPGGSGATDSLSGLAIPDMSNLVPNLGSEDSLIAQNNQSGKLKFLEDGVDPDKVYNTDKLHSPLSSYELKASSIIPLSLITGLNSDLPGKISAQVRENVYDSVTGEHLLIPQGSRMVGVYDSIITYGQERTLLVFNRILLPNGESISLEQFQGIDLQGYSGLHDRVNHHWFRILGSVVISGVLQGIADKADDSDELDLSDGQIVANSVSAEVARTAAKIIDKQINIQPTLTVRPGWNFNVFVEKDIVLKPYKQ